MNTKHELNALAFPNRRSFLKLAGLTGASALLSGCYMRRRVSYHYKLTLSLNTPNGVKTGSVVNEYERGEMWTLVTSWGYPYSNRGQALFVDMGPGRKPLIALMASVVWVLDFMPTFNRSEWHFNRVDWGGFGPNEILQSRAGYTRSTDPDDFEAIPKWKAEHFHVDLIREDLPALITFDDINDPLTVRVVDPFHLEDTLGPGVSWNSMTVDVVDDPLTHSLDKKLPWLAKKLELQQKEGLGIGLDGSTLFNGPASGKASLLNQIRLHDFSNL